VRIGLIPLTLAVAVAATRLTGATGVADAIGYIYFAFITARMSRQVGALAPARAHIARLEV
jgi:hypothetical protein